jgi:hypothetical protein
VVTDDECQLNLHQPEPNQQSYNNINTLRECLEVWFYDSKYKYRAGHLKSAGVGEDKKFAQRKTQEKVQRRKQVKENF